MANPNSPTEPNPAMSSAELRRRLLSSTPPPLDPEPAEPAASALTSWGSQDLLSRLRMPGGKNNTALFGRAARTAELPEIPEPESAAPVRPSVTRRTPPPTGRMQAIEPGSAIAGALNTLASIGEVTRGVADDSPMAEIQRLRAENKELRILMNEMKPLLQEASEIEQQFAVKEQQYSEALEERDAQIEALSAQLGAIEEQIAKGELAPPPPTPKTKSELEEWSDELEKESSKLSQERKRLNDDRRQLQEDEEGLEKQMRDMEVSMARERAMMARQETELKRLEAEILHQTEILQRGDAGLREQMVKFQRRAQEVLIKPPGGNPVRR
jgi:predicted  nucleic acid-binding Zn-ribbon protein